MNAVQKLEAKIRAGKYESLRSALSGITRTKHMKMAEKQRLAGVARQFFSNGLMKDTLTPVVIEDTSEEDAQLDIVVQRVLRMSLKRGWKVEDTLKRVEAAVMK